MAETKGSPSSAKGSSSDSFSLFLRFGFNLNAKRREIPSRCPTIRCFGMTPSGRGLLLGLSVTRVRSKINLMNGKRRSSSRLTSRLAALSASVVLYGIQFKPFEVLWGCFPVSKRAHLCTRTPIHRLERLHQTLEDGRAIGLLIANEDFHPAQDPPLLVR